MNRKSTKQESKIGRKAWNVASYVSRLSRLSVISDNSDRQIAAGTCYVTSGDHLEYKISHTSCKSDECDNNT